MCRWGVLIYEYSHKKLSDCLSIPGKKEVIPRKILGKAAAARAMIQIPCPVTGWEYKTEFNNAEALMETHTQFDHRTVYQHQHHPKNVGKEDTDAWKVTQAEPDLHRQDAWRGGRERLQAKVQQTAAFHLGESTGNPTI